METENDCTFTENVSIIHSYSYIKRLLQALQYYESLNISSNKDDQTKLVQFACNTYPSLIDDFTRIVTTHTNDIDDIYNCMINELQFNPCNIKNCSFSARHNRNREKATNTSNDKQFEFYKDLFDTIHCYLSHGQDFGLRINKQQRAKLQSFCDEAHNRNNIKLDNCIDPSFAKMRNMIYETRQNLQDLNQSDRFENTSKFTVNSTNDTTNSQNTLFMDGLIKYMTNHSSSTTKTIARIQQFINNEEYDTDAMAQDMDDITNSNICTFIEDEFLYNSMRSYTQSCNCMTYFFLYIYIFISSMAMLFLVLLARGISFSIGFIFYYWDYYKHPPSKELHDLHDNVNDHSGYTPQQLYIAAKYNSIKEEILNNTICPLSLQQFEICTTKCDKYMLAEKTKYTTTVEWVENHLHYGISKGSSIQYNHLLSLILYCDNTQLCTQFSSTFRKLKPYEDIESVKNRNKEFACWSKLLREAVQYYGSMGWDYRFDRDKKWNIERNRVQGPFYCGMSCVLAIPEYNIRLCSPTSTSKKIEVATRFGGEEGIIIQLNTNGYYSSENLRCFHCSWLSTYAGEDEYLFFGGDWRIKIETIRNIQTAENFCVFLHAMFMFDCMLNGTDMEMEQVNVDGIDYQILNNLIKHKLGINGYKNTYPRYINDTFMSFSNHKSSVIINYYHIDMYFKKLTDLILYSLEPTSISTDKEQDILKVDDTRNLFREWVFTLFANIKELIVYCTGGSVDDAATDFPYREYEFSLDGFLKIISKIRGMVDDDFKITMKARHKYRMNMESFVYEDIGGSWISVYWEKQKERIVNDFGRNGWMISLSQTQDASIIENITVDCFNITKCAPC